MTAELDGAMAPELEAGTIELALTVKLPE